MDNFPPGLIEAVDHSRLADGLDAAQRKVLAGVLSLQSHAPKEVLASEGQVDNRLYAVVAGRLSIVKHIGSDDEATLHTLGPGDFAHELGFLDGSERYASLVAATPVQVLVLERTRLETLIDSDPRVLYAVMCSIVRTVHRVQTRLAMHASELTNYIVKQHGRY